MLRRYTPLRPSMGTIIPLAVRRAVHERDLGCVGACLGWPSHRDKRGTELDHVLNSGMGKKGPSTVANLVALCNDCHRWKTENGRIARPQLLAYIARVTKGDA